MLVHVLLAASLVVGPAKAPTDPEAKELFELAQGAFEKGDYEAAANALERAYEIEPLPTFLYPWAQAERNRDNCKKAVELYRSYLLTEPPRRVRKAVEQNIDRCVEKLDAEAAAAETAVEDPDPGEEDPGEELKEPELDDPVETPTKSTKDDDVPKAKPWHRDVAGGVLVGIGLAGATVGGVLLGISRSTASSAGDESTNADYLDQRDRATALRSGGIAALTIGGALLIGGVVRWAIVARKGKRDRATAWATPRGGGFAVRF